MIETEVKDIGPVKTITESFTGSYNQSSEMIDELIAWLLQTGHPYSGSPFVIYYDDPAKVDEEKLRAKACLPVQEELEHTGHFEREEIEGGRFVTVTHQGGYEGISPLYEEIFDWISENGYEYIEEMGTREVFHKMLGEVDSIEELVTEILVPVKQKA